MLMMMMIDILQNLQKLNLKRPIAKKAILFVKKKMVENAKCKRMNNNLQNICVERQVAKIAQKLS